MPELFDYQREGVEFLHKTGGRALIGDQPGLGKTAQTITYIKEANLFPALIVCPNSVKGSWANEATMWAGKDTYQIEGETPNALPRSPVYVINYNILAAQVPALVKIPYKIVVFDESQNLSNRAAKWTKAAILLARRCSHAICTSGTPISNCPADFWPTLHIIQPALYPNFVKYAWKYCGPTRQFWGWDYKGASNMDKLAEEIKPFVIRRLKKEVLNLPEQRFHIVPVEIDDRAQYDQAESFFLKWLGTKKKRDAVDRAAKAEAITKVGYILRLTSQLKAKSTIQWIKDYMEQHPDKKLIVFCTHKQFGDVLERRLCPGANSRIDGSVPAKKRTAIIHEFQTNPKIRVIICQTKAAGAGITLTAATATVFVELPWTGTAVSQAQDRNYRIGQESDTDVYFLVGKDTMDHRLCEVIQRKQGLSDQLFDGKSESSLPIFDMLGEIK